jgi:putative redox protein
MVRLDWRDGIGFEAVLPGGHKIFLDSDDEEEGGQNRGSSPMQVLLVAAAACSAMDVISILRKKRQRVVSYRVEVEADRVPRGTWPRPFTAIRIKHFISGASVDPQAVQRAVELSDDKYCSVLATLRGSPSIASEWTVE